MMAIPYRRFTRASLGLAFMSVALTPAFSLFAQSDPSRLLPRGAVVIERARVPALGHPNRELLLWMISPVKHDRGELSESGYTCPEMTLGSYYSGPTRLSLLDTRSGRLLNTIKLIDPDDVDEFNIPYRIISGSYYLVPGVPKEDEGKPSLLVLRDLNGDGIAAETAFFVAEACMGLPTTLIGYSMAQDRVIQYRVTIKMAAFEQKTGGHRPRQRPRRLNSKVMPQVWTDYLFSKEPVEPGHWKYNVDYSGRGGCNDSYNVRYDAAGEKFLGTLTELCHQPERKPSSEK